MSLVLEESPSLLAIFLSRDQRGVVDVLIGAGPLLAAILGSIVVAVMIYRGWDELSGLEIGLNIGGLLVALEESLVGTEASYTEKRYYVVLESRNESEPWEAGMIYTRTELGKDEAVHVIQCLHIARSFSRIKIHPPRQNVRAPMSCEDVSERRKSSTSVLLQRRLPAWSLLQHEPRPDFRELYVPPVGRVFTFDCSARWRHDRFHHRFVSGRMTDDSLLRRLKRQIQLRVISGALPGLNNPTSHERSR